MQHLGKAASARYWGPWCALVVASCGTVLGLEEPTPRGNCAAGGCADGGGHSVGGDPGGGATHGGRSHAGTDSGGAGNASHAGQGGEPQGGGGATFGGTAGVGGAGAAGWGGSGEAGSPTCSRGARACDSYQPLECVSGQWSPVGKACKGACIDGACQEPPSCGPLGTLAKCADNVSCCDTIWVPGGQYQMEDGDEEFPDTSYTRSVSGFYLDRFEVTVSRFKTFVANFKLPDEGQGSHPLIPGTGWHKEWEKIAHPTLSGQTAVPANYDALIQQQLACADSTWSEDVPQLPVNCVNWYVAFAFCVYDGGRLPTEAEWNYAAALGNAQRVYPWSDPASNDAIDPTKATYYQPPAAAPLLPTRVGSHPSGQGGFYRAVGQGHEDLGGNLVEWTLDQWLDAPPPVCADCASPWSQSSDERVIRGGYYGSTYETLRAGWRNPLLAEAEAAYSGFRCARDANSNPE